MDMIAGFCNETEEDHLETLSLMDIVKYDMDICLNTLRDQILQQLKNLTIMFMAKSNKED